MGLALYLFASALYVGATQEHVLPLGLGDSGYHVAELDAATAGIVPFAESRTIAAGPSQASSAGGSNHVSLAVLRSIQHGVTSWIWQFELRRNEAPIHIRKEDLIYPFHYFW